MSNVEVTLPKPIIQQCVTCKKYYRVGELMCPYCGFFASNVGKTRKVESTSTTFEEKNWSLRVQDFTHTTIIFDIEGRQLLLPIAQHIIMGRTSGNYSPDIDLTPYGAEDKGISRQHLRITREVLIYVADLGSTNGTYLNGQRLLRNSDCPLTDGDVLRIGQLCVTVQFIRP
jgi:hypothetical protein